MVDKNFTKELTSLENIDFKLWIESYLSNSLNIDPKPPNTPYENHLFISILYQDCDVDLKKKILLAFEEILVAYNPPLSFNQGHIIFLFNIISISASIRSNKIKNMLKRFLISDFFQGLGYGPFYIREQLIISLSVYDYDVDVGNYLVSNLINKEDSSNCLLGAYRYFLDTNPNECFSILNQIFSVIKNMNEDFRKTAYYLLRLQIEKLGFNFIRMSTRNYLSNSIIAYEDLENYLDNINILIMRCELQPFYYDKDFTYMMIDLILFTYHCVFENKKYSYSNQQLEMIKNLLITTWSSIFHKKPFPGIIDVPTSIIQQLLSDSFSKFRDRSIYVKEDKYLFTLKNIFELEVDKKNIIDKLKIPIPDDELLQHLGY